MSRSGYRHLRRRPGEPARVASSPGSGGQAETARGNGGQQVVGSMVASRSTNLGAAGAPRARRRRRAAAVLGALAVVVGAAGCGEDTTEAASPDTTGAVEAPMAGG